MLLVAYGLTIAQEGAAFESTVCCLWLSLECGTGMGYNRVQVNSGGAGRCPAGLGQLQILLRSHGPRCVSPQA